MLVVDLDFPCGNFIRHKDVLVEDAAHGGGTLIAAAPGLDVAGLRLGIANPELDRLLTDDEHLLKLHLVMLVMRLQSSLDVVLDLGLGLLTTLLVLEVKGRWDVAGQLGRKLDGVDAWLKHAIWDGEHFLLVLEELLAVLQLLRPVLNVSLSVSMDSLSVVADEGAFFTTLNLQLDSFSLNSLHDFKVDQALHSVTGLIEGVCCLHLDLSLGEVAAIV